MKKMDDRRKDAIDKMRAKMAKKLGGIQRDHDEFKPAKVDTKTEKDYYFYVLPPHNDDDVFFERNGYHFINNRYVQCPRATNNEECPVCSMAFELMEGIEDREQRRSIAKRFLPQQKYAVNIVFTDDQVNGEFAGKVMWFNAPLTVFKKMQDAFMRDDPGEDIRKPKAYGDFFNPDEAYVFNLKVTEKGGYNNYEQSGFLAEQPGPVPNKAAVLNARFALRTKFPEQDMDALKDFVEKSLNGGMEEDTVENAKTEVKTESKSEPKPESKVEAKTESKTNRPQLKSEVAKASAPLAGFDDPELEKLMADLK